MPGTTRYSASLDQAYTEPTSPPPNGVGLTLRPPSSQGDSSVMSGMDRRSNSTDSLDDRSVSSGGHSRQVSQDSIEFIPTRITKVTVPKPVINPMQFVKTGPCHLTKTAAEQVKKAEELKKMRKEAREKEEDWQLNLDSWKNNRRKKQEVAIERMKEMKVLAEEQHERTRKKSKTFSEMMQERKTSRGRLPSLAIYTDDADQELSDFGVGKSSSASSLNTESPGRSISDSDRRTDSGTEMEDRLENEVEENAHKVEKSKYVTKEVTNGYDESGEEYTYDKAIQNYVNYTETHVKGKLRNEKSITDIKQNNVASVDSSKNKNTAVDTVVLRRGSKIEEKLAMLKASKDSSPERKISNMDKNNIDLVKRRSMFERLANSEEGEVKLKNQRSGDLSHGFKDALERSVQSTSNTDLGFREKLANFRNMELDSSESKTEFKQSESHSNKHDKPFYSVDQMNAVKNGDKCTSEKPCYHKNRYGSYEALDINDSQSYASERNLVHKDRGCRLKKYESFERTQSLGSLDRCGKYSKHGKAAVDDLSSSSMSPSSDEELNRESSRASRPSDRVNSFSKLEQPSVSEVNKPTHFEPFLNMNGHSAKSEQNQNETRSESEKDKQFNLNLSPLSMEQNRLNPFVRTSSTPYKNVDLASVQLQEEMCVCTECPRPPSPSCNSVEVSLLLDESDSQFPCKNVNSVPENNLTNTAETITSEIYDNSLEAVAANSVSDSPNAVSLKSSSRPSGTMTRESPDKSPEILAAKGPSYSSKTLKVDNSSSTEASVASTNSFSSGHKTMITKESGHLDYPEVDSEVKATHDSDEFLKKSDLDIKAEAKIRAVVDSSQETPDVVTMVSNTVSAQTPVNQEKNSSVLQTVSMFETAQLTALELAGDCAVLGDFDFPLGPPSSAEPPKEKPPPPPPMEVEEDHSTDDNLETQKDSKSKLVSQRIHKDLWRRRSDFLGIENVNEKDYLDLASQVTPPPDMKSILEAEREEDKKESHLQHINRSMEQRIFQPQLPADGWEMSTAGKWNSIEDAPPISSFQPVVSQEISHTTTSLEEDEIERKEREIIENLEKEEQACYHRNKDGNESQSTDKEEVERIRRLEEDRRKMEAERERREEERIQMEEENAHQEEQQRLQEKEHLLRMQETVVAKPVMVNESASAGLDSNLSHTQEEMLKLEKERLKWQQEELEREREHLKLQQQVQLQQAHIHQLQVQEQLQSRQQHEQLQQMEEAPYPNTYHEAAVPDSTAQFQHNIAVPSELPLKEPYSGALQSQYEQPALQNSQVPVMQQVCDPSVPQSTLQLQENRAFIPTPRSRKVPPPPPRPPTKPRKPSNPEAKERNEMIRLSRNPSATFSPDDEPPALPPKHFVKTSASAPCLSKQWPPETACGQQMSRNTLHALSASPRSKLISSESWIAKKKPESQTRENFNHNKHWLIQEAEHRRITELQQRKAHENSVQVPPAQHSQWGTTPSLQSPPLQTDWMASAGSNDQSPPSQGMWKNAQSSGDQSPSPQALWISPEANVKSSVTSQVPWRNAVGNVGKTVPIHAPWKKLSPSGEQPQPQWRATSSQKEKPLPDSIIQTLTQRVQNKTAFPNYANLSSSHGSSPTSSSGGVSVKLDLDGEQVDSESPRDYTDVNPLFHGKPPSSQTPSSSGGMPAPQVPAPVSREQREKMLSVSGKKKCSHCGDELGRGAAMIIESLRLFYHIDCFKCCVCHVQLGNGKKGTDVRVRNNKLHCHNCYSNDEGLKFSKV